jgi:hypothetical protein
MIAPAQPSSGLLIERRAARVADELEKALGQLTTVGEYQIAILRAVDTLRAPAPTSQPSGDQP